MIDRKFKPENWGISYSLDTVEPYGIPIIDPTIIENVPQMVGFNFARSETPKGKALHFFVDDYQFSRVWNSPERYIGVLKQFDFVLSPDFSTYTDYPKVLQLYNHYKKHVLAAYWQQNGITVIPTISWSDKSSFEWCFDGEPCGGTVAVSSVGTQQNEQTKENFINGYFEMIERLNPYNIIFYGNIPKECTGNMIRVRSFQEKFKEAKIDGR